MAPATATVYLVGMEPFRQMVDGARQMRAYADGGGDGWWAGWAKVRAAVAALDTGPTPAEAAAVADPDPADQLEHARRRARIAEDALADLHRLVEDRLDPDPGAWDDYHTHPQAKQLAVRLWRANTPAAGDTETR